MEDDHAHVETFIDSGNEAEGEESRESLQASQELTAILNEAVADAGLLHKGKGKGTEKEKGQGKGKGKDKKKKKKGKRKGSLSEAKKQRAVAKTTDDKEWRHTTWEKFFHLYPVQRLAKLFKHTPDALHTPWVRSILSCVAQLRGALRADPADHARPMDGKEGGHVVAEHAAPLRAVDPDVAHPRHRAEAGHGDGEAEGPA